MDIESYIKALKMPYLFAEFLTVIVGLVFIFVLNFVYEPNLSNFPNLSFINEISRTVLLVVFAYFLGCIFSLISEVWFGVLRFVFVRDKKRFLKLLREQYRRISNRDRVKISPEQNRRYDAEEFMENKEYLRSLNVRRFYKMHFVRLLTGMLIVFLPLSRGIEYPIIFWVIFSIFLLSLLEAINLVRDSDSKINLASHLEHLEQ
ncbi:MAG: hypothetical protein ACEQSB_05875 [Undibacterium sp.]